VIQVLAIQHVPFEDLGSLGHQLARRGFAVQTIEACTAQFESADLLAPELVVVLGGPIGVYETDAYPFLKLEIVRLRDRLVRGPGTSLAWGHVRSARGRRASRRLRALSKPGLVTGRADSRASVPPGSNER
jgi:hypothetical protein